MVCHYEDNYVQAKGSHAPFSPSSACNGKEGRLEASASSWWYHNTNLHPSKQSLLCLNHCLSTENRKERGFILLVICYVFRCTLSTHFLWVDCLYIYSDKLITKGERRFQTRIKTWFGILVCGQATVWANQGFFLFHNASALSSNDWEWFRADQRKYFT